MRLRDSYISNRSKTPVTSETMQTYQLAIMKLLHSKLFLLSPKYCCIDKIQCLCWQTFVLNYWKNWIDRLYVWQIASLCVRGYINIMLLAWLLRWFDGFLANRWMLWLSIMFLSLNKCFLIPEGPHICMFYNVC